MSDDDENYPITNQALSGLQATAQLQRDLAALRARRTADLRGHGYPSVDDHPQPIASTSQIVDAPTTVPSPVPADHPTQQEAYYTDDDEALAQAIQLSLQDDPEDNAADEGQLLDEDTVDAQEELIAEAAAGTASSPVAAHDDVAIALQVAEEGGILDLAYEDDDEDDDEACQEDKSPRMNSDNQQDEGVEKRAQLLHTLPRLIRDIPIFKGKDPEEWQLEWTGEILKAHGLAYDREIVIATWKSLSEDPVKLMALLDISPGEDPMPLLLQHCRLPKSKYGVLYVRHGDGSHKVEDFHNPLRNYALNAPPGPNLPSILEYCKDNPHGNIFFRYAGESMKTAEDRLRADAGKALSHMYKGLEIWEKDGKLSRSLIKAVQQQEALLLGLSRKPPSSQAVSRQRIDRLLRKWTATAVAQKTGNDWIDFLQEVILMLLLHALNIRLGGRTPYAALADDRPSLSHITNGNWDQVTFIGDCPSNVNNDKLNGKFDYCCASQDLPTYQHDPKTFMDVFPKKASNAPDIALMTANGGALHCDNPRWPGVPQSSRNAITRRLGQSNVVLALGATALRGVLEIMTSKAAAVETMRSWRFGQVKVITSMSGQKYVVAYTYNPGFISYTGNVVSCQMFAYTMGCVYELSDRLKSDGDMVTVLDGVMARWQALLERTLTECLSALRLRRDVARGLTLREAEVREAPVWHNVIEHAKGCQVRITVMGNLHTSYFPPSLSDAGEVRVGDRIAHYFDAQAQEVRVLRQANFKEVVELPTDDYLEIDAVPGIYAIKLEGFCIPLATLRARVDKNNLFYQTLLEQRLIKPMGRKKPVSTRASLKTLAPHINKALPIDETYHAQALIVNRAGHNDISVLLQVSRIDHKRHALKFKAGKSFVFYLDTARISPQQRADDNDFHMMPMLVGYNDNLIVISLWLYERREWLSVLPPKVVKATATAEDYVTFQFIFKRKKDLKKQHDLTALLDNDLKRQYYVNDPDVRQLPIDWAGDWLPEGNRDIMKYSVAQRIHANAWWFTNLDENTTRCNGCGDKLSIRGDERKVKQNHLKTLRHRTMPQPGGPTLDPVSHAMKQMRLAREAAATRD